MKKYTQEKFNNFIVVNGIKQCPTGNYSLIKNFAERCSFAEGCNFRFFPVSILKANLYQLSSKLTLELMRRDAMII